MTNSPAISGQRKKLGDGIPRRLTFRRTPPVRIDWDEQPSGYVVNTDNWIVL